MLTGLRGTLLSRSFADSALFTTFEGRLHESSRAAGHRRLNEWWRRCRDSLGPASGVRSILDRAAIPLVTQLGYRVPLLAVPHSPTLLLATLEAHDGPPVGLLVTTWAEDLDHMWREVVKYGIGIDARWCLCFNGRQLRVVDTQRTYARRFLEFDLDTALEDEKAFAILWGLLRADALTLSKGVAKGSGLRGARHHSTLLDEVTEHAERHETAVSSSLQDGVRTALTDLLEGLITGSPAVRHRWTTVRDLPTMFEQSLTVVYRILFLLFAEARGLVPRWHPIYRDNYTIEALRDRIDDPQRSRGLWEALQAIWRLVHGGCHAGDLVVTPFNGRLFAPARTPLVEQRVVNDEATRRALVALTTRPTAGRVGRERIAYGDLGVEQLGAIYEQVLDCSPRISHAEGGRANVHLHNTGRRRKATSTFYTPRSITAYLVRRTLHPLVEGKPADAILKMRVLDPAMGSGAFLVGACRYLGTAYESALVRDSECLASDIGESDRAEFRRLIAQRCLVGVDLNPMAVQLARLSLWLSTLAADRPLTFLDHHLLVGNSLIGASLDDLARQPPGSAAARRRPAPVASSLFDGADLEMVMREAVQPLARIASDPGDTVSAIREKERALAQLAAPDSPLARWKAAADLWCAGWFWNPGSRTLSPALVAALTDAIVQGQCELPERNVRDWLDQVRDIAASRQFFHWTLEFPDVFFDAAGQPLSDPGFDVILGNPPWDVLRADEGNRDDRQRDRAPTRQLVRFARDSGIYQAQSTGHPNRYQLFVERALMLARQGGRIGLVLPSGLAADHGCADLRRLLLERCDTDTLVGFDNRDGIFPVHRSVKFLLMTSTKGHRTTRLRCRFGERDPRVLDTIPDGAPEHPSDGFPVVLTPALIERLSGEQLAIPDLRTPTDVAIVDKVYSTWRGLADHNGWGARFGRELNASDDRPFFVERGRGLPVIAGRHIAPFVVDLASSRFRIPEAVAAKRLDRVRSFGRSRLAYRDVASATNRLTLIAAIVPAGTVTTHTLCCLKTGLHQAEQQFLCGVLNSFVTNYLIRQRVTTHVTVTIIDQLPVPRPSHQSYLFQHIAKLSRRQSDQGAGAALGLARLQALVAVLYDLTVSEFRHVLTTFPLVRTEEKAAAMREFRELVGVRTELGHFRPTGV